MDDMREDIKILQDKQRVFLDMDFANASHVDMAKTLLRFPAIDTTDPPDVEDNLLQWSTFQGPFAFAVNFDELNEATLSFKEARGNVHLQFAACDTKPSSMQDEEVSRSWPFGDAPIAARSELAQAHSMWSSGSTPTTARSKP